MAVEAEAKPSPSGHTGKFRAFLRHAWSFVTSRFGLTILAPLFGALATILGAAATSSFTAREQIQTERGNAIESLRLLVDSTIAERALYSDTLARALARPTTQSELREDWSTYQKAAHAYKAQYWEHQLDIERNTLPGTTDEIFAKYLNVVIYPAFESVDTCLSDAHDAFLASGDASARAALSACQMSAKLAALIVCTRDFTHEFDWSVLIERQVLGQDESSWSRFGSNATYAYHLVAEGQRAACKANADCRQMLFFGNLRAALAASCGPLPKVKSRNLPVLSSLLPKS